MKVHFSDLFNVQNGAISPKKTVHINGITMGPGVSFGSGVSFSGIDLSQYINKYFEVEDKDGATIIIGVY